MESNSNLAPPVTELEKKLRELKELRYYRLTGEAYRYYEPIGVVGNWISKAASGRYTSILLEAANGVGKTMAAVNFMAHLFWPCQNKYFQGPLFQKWPYPKQVRIVSDPNTITETIIPTMVKIFPKGRFGSNKYTTTKEGKHYDTHWITDTGWNIHLMTYEQDLKEFESATIGLVWCDEPPPEAVYIACYARLRMGGIFLLTETPLTGSQWLYDKFIELPPEELEQQKKAVVHATLEDACVEHGIRGFMPHERIENMASQYDEEEKLARVFGKHTHLAGLIFKRFDDSIHIIKPFALKPSDWVVVHCLDPHTRVNDAGLWVAFGKERIIVCAELWGSYETDELAERIKNESYGYRIKMNLIDPSADIVDKHTGRSLMGDLKNYGLYYEQGSKARSSATRMIKDELDYRKHNDEFIKPPHLYFFDTCPRTIWEMKHWQWEDWRGKNKNGRDPKERPVDKDDHMIECLGRALLSGVHWEPLPVERETSHQLSLDPY